MNTPINFQLAKLLKEKGFNEVCFKRFNEDGELTDTKLSMHEHPNNYSGSYSAPTIAEVVMWLYEKYEIWIEVRKSYLSGFVPVVKEPRVELDKFNSPTEAYESAIKYVLNNLI